MPLVLVDGFEDASLFTNNAPGWTVAAARTGNGLTTSGTSMISIDLTKIIGGVSDMVTLGFAFKFNTVSVTGIYPMFGMSADDRPNITDCFSISPDVGSGAIRLRDTNSTVQATSAGGVLVSNQWMYMEVKARNHDTLGSVQVRVNGNTIFNVTNIDTRKQSEPGFGSIYWCGSSASLLPFMIDDFYFATGSLADPFYGDCRVDYLVPNGDGAVNGWMGSDGNSVANWQLVDELPPVMTDYVQSSTVGQQDLYTMTDMTMTTGTVVAVCPTFLASKDEVGPRQLKPIVRRTAINGGTVLPLDFAPSMRQGFFTTDPETGAAWTQANVNALQVGVETV